MESALLNLENLSVQFATPEGSALAVDHVDLQVGAGETLGLVGESGCGKSVTSLAVLGLIPEPPGKITSGRIVFEDRDLLALSAEEMRSIRGRSISMIFQEPMTSLNPVMTVGRQVAEPLMVHLGLSRSEAWDKAKDLLDLVRIPAPGERLLDYPHHLSGGMRQRVMIAMALACDPRLLIADEPTTALDVTIQAQILSLLVGLKEELGTSILLITHDLGVVAQMASRVVVMYAGQVVEEAEVKSLFREPLHPYTKGLLGSIPVLGRKFETGRTDLQEVRGFVPSLLELPLGCRFHPRCDRALERCPTDPPPMLDRDGGGKVRCWLWA